MYAVPFLRVYTYCVCVCTCTCTCAPCTKSRTDSKLRFSAHPPTLLALEDSSLSPLSTLTSTFFSSDIHITLLCFPFAHFFTLCPSLSTFYVTLFSLSFPPFLTHFSFLSLICSMFLHFLFLQEPQTTVIHNPSDGRKVYIIPQASPILYPLCHSPPLPHCLLLYDPSF